MIFENIHIINLTLIYSIMSLHLIFFQHILDSTIMEIIRVLINLF